MSGRDTKLHANIGWRNLAQASNLARWRRHAHLKHSDVELFRSSSARDHLKDRERKAQTVVVVPLALEHAPPACRHHVRRQILRSGLPGAPRYSHYRTIPALVNSMREFLKSGNRVINQKKFPAQRFEPFVAANALASRDAGQGSAHQCVGDELVRVNELAVEARALVVTLRNGEEQFAPVYLTRGK